MSRHITQKALFKKTRSKTLLDLYMNAKKHAQISGSPVKVSSNPNAYAIRIFLQPIA